jgi:hypothetical protein
MIQNATEKALVLAWKAVFPSSEPHLSRFFSLFPPQVNPLNFHQHHQDKNKNKGNMTVSVLMNHYLSIKSLLRKDATPRPAAAFLPGDLKHNVCHGPERNDVVPSKQAHGYMPLLILRPTQVFCAALREELRAQRKSQYIAALW